MNDPRVRDYIAANEQRFLDELKELVRIPSISALPEHHDDCGHAAAWLAAQLREQVGMQAEVIATAGRPLVYGEWLGAPDKPTVLIYGHYDVQPVDPLELWMTPPFAATLVGESLYGRGAVDDKGPTLAALKALEALARGAGGLPVNVKVLIEGEEESGVVAGSPARSRRCARSPRRLLGVLFGPSVTTRSVLFLASRTRKPLAARLQRHVAQVQPQGLADAHASLA
jgi:acetylornithine deacetylase/succinyl-diaminopimelate desuccinylase-like protein